MLHSIRGTRFHRSFSTVPATVLASRYVALLHEHSRDPAFRIAYQLNGTKTAGPYISAPRGQINAPGMKSWSHVAKSANIQSAIGKLSPNALSHIPPWLVIYLAAYKVKTEAHALHGLMELVNGYKPGGKTGLAYSPPLMILASVHLAHYGLFLPLRKVQEDFMHLPLPNPSNDTQLYFNLFLIALAQTRPFSSQKAKLLLELLRRMEGRQLNLTQTAYTHLLADPHLTLELSSHLSRLATHSGIVPTPENIEAQMKAFGDGSEKGERMIKTLTAELNRSRLSSITGADWYAQPKPILQPGRVSVKGKERDTSSTANSLIIQGQKDSGSAFEFLTRLLKIEAATTKNTSLIAKAMDISSFPAPSLSSPQFRAPDEFNVNISDFNSALQSAARDKRTSSDRLTQLFDTARDRSPAFRRTVGSYGILMTGLLKRGDVEHAMSAFVELLQSGLPMDTIALSGGVRAIARCGHPHRAVGVLAHYVGASDNVNPMGFEYPLQRVGVNILVLNEFMSSLLRVDRPDAVFRLWDSLPVLFKVHPDDRTLAVLLRSACRATELDGWSQFARANHFRWKHPFKRPIVNPHSPKRDVAYKSILDVLGDPLAQSATPYENGVWHGQYCLDAVTQIFVRAAFGQAVVQGGQPLLDEMLRTEAPAHPIRDGKSEKLYVRAKPLPPFDLVNEKLLNDRGSSWYPNLILTTESFMEYLLVLARGGGHGSAESARALLWMRLLSIEPSYDLLCLAIALFHDVSFRVGPREFDLDGTPLMPVEKIRKKNQFERFMVWLKDWVGQERIPSPVDIRRWQKKVRWVQGAAR
ncbi:hypothetical protein DL96DRAFT_1586836 [Flagelloscypha sp. PMI_526]|nr:hypothetical protein DL96DRAFT_1586836 [Flagelloscypha sp. PMI_526]